MAEGRQQEAWRHTSSVLALVANVNRDPKRRPKPFEPADFDPTQAGRRAKVERIDAPLSALRVFLPPRKGR